MKVRSFIRHPQELERAWPEILAPADMMSGDEALRVDLGSPADTAFMDAYFGVLAGSRPWGATAEFAKKLGLDGPITHDRRPLLPAPVAVPDAVISDFVEDWIPDIGMIAPDRVLGPFSEGIIPRRVRMASCAAMAHAPLIPPAVSPIRRVVRSRPRPPTAMRSSLKRIGMSPPVVWRRLGDWKVGSGCIAPISLVHKRFVPTSELDGLPRAPVVIGRAVLGVDGWFLSAVLPLPVEPDPVVLNRRVTLELQRYRRHEPRLTWEDLLRQRGEILFRTACEWSFAHAPEEVLQCWNHAW